jgi:hypothetical protein
LEVDNDALNEKYRKEVAVREQVFSQNDQLNKALRRANIKVAEVKEKYQRKVAKKCYYCNNELDINTLMMQQTMGGPGFNSTLDNIQSALGT